MTPLGIARKISAHLKKLGFYTETDPPKFASGDWYEVYVYSNSRKIHLVGSVAVDSELMLLFLGPEKELLEELVS
jgi:hypothetical protein